MRILALGMAFGTITMFSSINEAEARVAISMGPNRGGDLYGDSGEIKWCCKFSEREVICGIIPCGGEIAMQ